jgi:hypothetical protein
LPVVTNREVFGEIIVDVLGLELGENCGARISGAFGAIPKLKIFGKINFSLAGFGFGLLDAENIGLLAINKTFECAFFYYGAETVDIPRVNLHIYDYNIQKEAPIAVRSGRESVQKMAQC